MQSQQLGICVDYDALVDAADTATLTILHDNYHIPSGSIQQAMQRAVETDHVLMVKFLHRWQSDYSSDIITYAFNKCSLKVVGYLQTLGISIQSKRIRLDADAWSKARFCMQDLVATGVDMEHIIDLLMHLGIFHIEGYHHDTTPQPHLISRLISAAKWHHQTMWNILAAVATAHSIDAATYLLCEKFHLLDVTAVKFLIQVSGPLATDSLNCLFENAYADSRPDKLVILIYYFDPELRLEIHREQWRFIVLYTSLATVRAYDLRYGLDPQKLATLSVDTISTIKQTDVVEYLVQQGVVQISDRIGELFDCALRQECAIRARFYARQLLLTMEADEISQNIYRLAYYRRLPFEVLAVLVDLGLFGHYGLMQTAPSVMKPLLPLYLLRIKNGLMWTAASFYAQHTSHLPTPESIPENVYHMLCIAKYIRSR